MSRTNRGIIVKYTDINGNIQKGLVRPIDQHQSFTNVNKALIRLLNDDLTIKLDDDKKSLVALKNIDLLTHIGFID